MDKTYPIDINSLFIKTIERNASDLHLVPGVPPYIRVDGKLEPLDMPVIAPEVLKDLIYSILTEQQIKTLEKELELDFAYSISGVSRFRGNILIGEMRDLDSISIALTAAETGHLVLSTLHTQNAPLSISRIIDVFNDDKRAYIRQQLSNSLQGIISQQLIPRIDGKGRVVAVEFMLSTPAVRNLIREGKEYQLYAIQCNTNWQCTRYANYGSSPV